MAEEHRDHGWRGFGHMNTDGLRLDVHYNILAPQQAAFIYITKNDTVHILKDSVYIKTTSQTSRFDMSNAVYKQTAETQAKTNLEIYIQNLLQTADALSNKERHELQIAQKLVAKLTV